MFVRYLPIFILFFAISCSKNHKQNLKNQTLDSNEVGQAKELDTPAPLGYKSVTQETTNNISHTTYEGGLSIAQAKAFYLQEMERLGWDITNLSTEQEGLLICNKMHKKCIVSIRPYHGSKRHKKKTILHHFIKSSISFQV